MDKIKGKVTVPPTRKAPRADQLSVPHAYSSPQWELLGTGKKKWGPGHLGTRPKLIMTGAEQRKTCILFWDSAKGESTLFTSAMVTEGHHVLTLYSDMPSRHRCGQGLQPPLT